MDTFLSSARLYVLAGRPSQHPNPDVLMFLLGQRGAEILGGAVASSISARCHLLHTVAIGTTRFQRDCRLNISGSFIPREFNGAASKWNLICCSLICSLQESELHSIDTIQLDDIMKGYSRTPPTSWTGSPLVSVLQALFLDEFPAQEKYQRWDNCLSETIRLWLEQVYKAGIDLLEYGAKETELMFFKKRDNRACLEFLLRRSLWSPERRSIVRDSVPVCLLGFTPSPVAGGWVFNWQVDVEKLAGEFWRTLEEGIVYLQPPGAWIE